MSFDKNKLTNPRLVKALCEAIEANRGNLNTSRCDITAEPANVQRAVRKVLGLYDCHPSAQELRLTISNAYPVYMHNKSMERASKNLERQFQEMFYQGAKQ